MLDFYRQLGSYINQGFVIFTENDLTHTFFIVFLQIFSSFARMEEKFVMKDGIYVGKEGNLGNRQ